MVVTDSQKKIDKISNFSKASCHQKQFTSSYPLFFLTLDTGEVICFTLRELLDLVNSRNYINPVTGKRFSKSQLREMIDFMKSYLEMHESDDNLVQEACDIDKFDKLLHDNAPFMRSVYSCDDCDTVIKKIFSSESRTNSDTGKEILNLVMLGKDENILVPEIVSYCKRKVDGKYGEGIEEVIEMEKVGISVQQKIRELTKVLSVEELDKEVCKLLKDCIKQMESLHSLGFIHDDTHLGNFVFIKKRIGLIDVESVMKYDNEDLVSVDYLKFYSSFTLMKAFEILLTYNKSETIKLMREVVSKFNNLKDYAVRMIMTRGGNMNEQAQLGMEFFMESR